MKTLTPVPQTRFHLLIFLFLNGIMLSFAQGQHDALSKQDFEDNMKTYIDEYVSDADNLNRIKNTKNIFEIGQIPNDSDFEEILKEEAKSKYIQDYKNKYRDIYFPITSAMGSNDTLICDNGGFEDDFDFYMGSTATYFKGSSTCTPKLSNNQDVTYTSEVLPSNGRFKIVSPGIDPLVGFSKVKFGQKTLQINDQYVHSGNSTCNGNRDINRIVKKFKVTDENRDFTIWYAVALENPVGHNNTQPFFNIKCDRAPNNDLCFDAKLIECEEFYADSLCVYENGIDAIDWTCHRFKIPKEYIDSIATLEIIVADCGLGGHMGYAYIDGICEDCDSSALGSIILSDTIVDFGVGIDYTSCDGDIATLCGYYTLPTICGDWSPLDIEIPGYDVSNLQIDTSTNTFCFDFPISNFGDEDCIEIYADYIFSSAGFDLPTQPSNSIEICKSKYETYEYRVFVSPCLDNDTPNLMDPTPIISDDHYFVEVDLTHFPDGSNWTITRQLFNPYPNESGSHEIADGIGGTYLNLGPFLIQEGDWYLIIEVDGCYYYEYIPAPNYCSGCDDFGGLKIYDIECDDNTWSFKYKVIKTNNQFGSYYKINNGLPQIYNMEYTEGPLSLDDICLDYTLTSYKIVNGSHIPQCSSEFTICPPKPCDKRCDLEVYVRDVICTKGENNFEIEIDIDATLNTGQFICYKTENVDPTSTTPDIQGTGIPTQNILGPFTEDVFLTVFICNFGEDCIDCYDNSECYKKILVPKLVCDDSRFEKEQKKKIDIGNKILSLDTEFMIVPNPVQNDEFILRSNLIRTQFEIYTINGKMMHEGTFEGEEHEISLDITSGIYFVRYLDIDKKPQVIKMIKL